MSIKAFRGFTRTGSALTSVVLLALVAVAAVMSACSSSSDNNEATGPFTVVGFVKTTPSVQGEWNATTTTTVDHCGAKALPLPTKFIVGFEQAGSTLGGTVSTVCGDPIGALNGTVDFNNVVSFTFDETLAIGPSCTVTVHHDWVGTVKAPQGTMSGTAKANLTASGDCGTAYPCNVNGTFAASYCSRGQCARQPCSP
jgi:hypothetical protein